MPRIAWLSIAEKDDETASGFTSFLNGMNSLGYVRGRNVIIEESWGQNSRETTDRLAAQIAARKPDVIVAQGPAMLSMRKLPVACPVVFGFSGDPVDAGVAKSFARPGGYFTGISFLALDLVGKRVELLREMLPKARRLAVLASPDHPGDNKELAVTRKAAERFGMEISYFETRKPADIDAAFSGAAAARAEAMIVHPTYFIVQAGARFANLSLQTRIPAVSGWSTFADAGNIFTYGPNLADGFGRLAYFVDRLLKGASAADLPIELPRSVEFVFNLKSARSLGLAVPPILLSRADRVIQ